MVWFRMSRSSGVSVIRSLDTTLNPVMTVTYCLPGGGVAAVPCGPSLLGEFLVFGLGAFGRRALGNAGDVIDEFLAFGDHLEMSCPTQV